MKTADHIEPNSFGMNLRRLGSKVDRFRAEVELPVIDESFFVFNSWFKVTETKPGYQINLNSAFS